jgi:hypothetical protein
MPHNMDELLHAAGLPTDIDVIPDLTGDYETAPTSSTPHPHTSPMRMPISRLSLAA